MMDLGDRGDIHGPASASGRAAVPFGARGGGGRVGLWRDHGGGTGDWGCILTRSPRAFGSGGGAEPSGRVRAPGGGRKPASEADPGLLPALTALVASETRGDPESPLVWTTKSTKNLADALARDGHVVSDRTVARMLRAQGFSLQANSKVTEGRQHIDRDAQFSYLNAQVIEHLAHPLRLLLPAEAELCRGPGRDGHRPRVRLPGVLDELLPACQLVEQYVSDLVEADHGRLSSASDQLGARVLAESPPRPRRTLP